MDAHEALSLLLEQIDVLRAMLHRFDYVFVISVLLAWIEPLSKGYVFHGQGQTSRQVLIA